MTSGEWTGTMCLTEPHCGTDLGLMRTKAEPQADGTYKITGNKIFISAGEHDMAANIIHLVLARLPDAPPGIKGVSLFIVPKFLREGRWLAGRAQWHLLRRPGAQDGHPRQRHVRRWCWTAPYGTMVGQPNKGMQAMFVMMNAARLGVGNQSLGLTEVAYQNALAYAKDRIQMRSLSGTKAKDKPADPIIVHPDVRKMLLTAKAYAEGGRALAMFCSVLLEKVHNHPDEKVRKDSDEMLSLLTPIVKAFLTDNGYKATTHVPAGLRRPRLHQGMGHGAVRARRPHQHDLRRHQHHPVAGPAGPQGAGQQRRHTQEVRQAGGRAGG